MMSNILDVSFLILYEFALLISVESIVPIYVWPLDNTTYTTEIKTNPNSAISSSQCHFTFGHQPPTFSNPVLELNGSSYLDLHVSYVDVSNKDYAFSGRFFLKDKNVALFHYKANDQTDDFKEMMLHVDNGYLVMRRTVAGVAEEVSNNGITQMSINAWYALSFGIDVSAGKMLVRLNNNKEIEDDFTKNVLFVTPGILRVGGTFDQSRPNFTGRVSCVEFWKDKKDPNSAEGDAECTSTSIVQNVPDCSPTPIVERINDEAGYFHRLPGIQLNSLHQMLKVEKCSQLRCAVACLRHHGCWYYRYDNSGINSCVDCVLYDSSVATWQASGPFDTNVYKWRG